MNHEFQVKINLKKILIKEICIKNIHRKIESLIKINKLKRIINNLEEIKERKILITIIIGNKIKIIIIIDHKILTINKDSNNTKKI